VTDAPIILCDEPTANLDKGNKEIFIEMIEKLHKIGKTIIISTHDHIFQNLTFMDRVFYIENGEIVE